MSQNIELFDFGSHLCDDECMDQFHYMVLSCFCNDQVELHSRETKRDGTLMVRESDANVLDKRMHGNRHVSL